MEEVQLRAEISGAPGDVGQAGGVGEGPGCREAVGAQRRIEASENGRGMPNEAGEPRRGREGEGPRVVGPHLSKVKVEPIGREALDAASPAGAEGAAVLGFVGGLQRLDGGWSLAVAEEREEAGGDRLGRVEVRNRRGEPERLGAALPGPQQRLRGLRLSGADLRAQEDVRPLLPGFAAGGDEESEAAGEPVGLREVAEPGFVEGQGEREIAERLGGAPGGESAGRLASTGGGFERDTRRVGRAFAEAGERFEDEPGRGRAKAPEAGRGAARVDSRPGDEVVAAVARERCELGPGEARIGAEDLSHAARATEADDIGAGGGTGSVCDERLEGVGDAVDGGVAG